jgi:hypothetical protein
MLEDLRDRPAAFRRAFTPAGGRHEFNCIAKYLAIPGEFAPESLNRSV